MRSTGWSPVGTARARCSYPAVSRRRGRVAGSPSRLRGMPGECAGADRTRRTDEGIDVDQADVAGDLERVLVTEEQLRNRLAELGVEIASDYAGRKLLLVGVLKGAVMVMADLSRALPMHVEMDWMAV